MSVEKQECEAFNRKIDRGIMARMRAVLDITHGKEHYELPEELTPEIADHFHTHGGRGSTYVSTLNAFRKYGVLPLILHYPEIMAKNGLGQSWKMKDLYVAVGVDAEGRLLPIIYGMGVTKTTVSPIEYLNHFCHPQGGSLSSWGGVCLGGGTPISHSLHQCVMKDFNEKSFQGFLVDVKTYLEWENIDAGYNQMSVMTKKLSTWKRVIGEKETPKDLYERLLKKNIQAYISFDGREVLFGGGFTGLVSDCLREMGRDDLLFVMQNGKAVEKEGNFAAVSVGPKEPHFLTFNGAKQAVVVEDFNNVDSHVLTRVAHPSIVSEICNKLRNNLCKKIVYAQNNKLSKKSLGGVKYKTNRKNIRTKVRKGKI